jgi:Putative Ig domain
MFYGLTCPAQKEHSKRTIWLQHAALVALLFGIVVFNGCSGSAVPGAKSVPAPSSSSSNNSNSNSNPTPSLTISATLPPATAGSGYKATIAVSGGVAPYTFSVASGALPQGVGLGDTSGTVSGTPTASGSFNFAVSVSDSKGDSNQQSLQMTVASAPASNTSAPSGGNSFAHVQRTGGWNQYGQKGPNYVDCSPSPCEGISFAMTQGVGSPSMSGQASEFSIGGSAPFADGLWNNHLIGPSSSQGMADANQTLVPTLHNFTYDVYFYGDNLGLAQALEFDINQFFNGMGFIFGHECRIAGGNEWDVFDNQKGKWIPTGIPCNPKSNAWNHLTIKVQRTSDDHLVYQSITLNGATHDLSWTFGHGSAPGWYGVTVNYQMDGNQRPDAYKVYLDELTFSYQ